MKFLKKILAATLSFLLLMNSAFALRGENQEQLLREFSLGFGSMNFQQILEQGLRETKSKEDRATFLEGLSIIAKNPTLGKVQFSSALDNMSYFFINNLEKDFIAYPKTYSFYIGFRKVFRGDRMAAYTKACVYHRSNQTPFTMIDYLNGKFNCQPPRNYPPKSKKEKIISDIEKSFENLERIAYLNYHSAGEKFAQGIIDLLILPANAITTDKKLLIAVVTIGVGAAIIAVGMLATPLAAIGIPIIALGCASVVTGLAFMGWGIADKIKLKRRPSPSQ